MTGQRDVKFSSKVLALDLATVTGWAYGEPGNAPEFGSLRFAKPGAPHGEVYRGMRAWLNDWITDSSLIVYESPAAASVMMGKTNLDTLRLLIGLCEHVEELCYGRIDLREARVSDVRAHFIGTNKIKRADAKVATIDRCLRLGWKVDNDNEADACALWHFQICCLRPDLAVKTVPLFNPRWIER